jgi:hypothetical protein
MIFDSTNKQRRSVLILALRKLYQLLLERVLRYSTLCWILLKVSLILRQCDLPGNFALYSIQQLDANVQGITVPLSGHWIPEEQPDFVVDVLFKFLRNTTK